MGQKWKMGSAVFFNDLLGFFYEDHEQDDEDMIRAVW